MPRLELLRGLEVAEDLAVFVIRGHSVPQPRREVWRAGFDASMEPLAEGAIGFGHLGDLREHVAFPVRLLRGRLHLLDTVLHRGFFFFAESLLALFGRSSALSVHWIFPP